MAVPVLCTQCGGAIAPDDINVAEGIAYCRECRTLNRLATLLEAADLSDVDPADPPTGCSMRDEGAQIVISASPRSLASAGGMIFFAVFWNGVVSVLVFPAIEGLLYHTLGAVPAWFPHHPFSGGSGQTLPIGMVIFLCFFLIPFVAIGLSAIAMVLTTLLGRCEVRLRGPEGIAFTGVGPFGWTRRFDASAVRSIRSGDAGWSEDNQQKVAVIIEADRTIRIGSILPEQRRRWMEAALRRLLLN